MNIAEEEMPKLVLENKHKGGLNRFAALLSQPNSDESQLALELLLLCLK